MELGLHSKEVAEFVNDKSFPCIMAKTVMKRGYCEINSYSEIESDETIQSIMDHMYQFIESFRMNRQKMSSFILILENSKYDSYQEFEKKFWSFLSRLNVLDKEKFPHDPRVSSNPKDDDFSYSIKEEAFFILTLHPENPRWSRRFKYPAIIFNPHIQFEELRSKGIFKKIQKIIRQKDTELQGDINPMLNDFGERSEVFQYTGRVYAPNEKIPLMI